MRGTDCKIALVHDWLTGMRGGEILLVEKGGINRDEIERKIATQEAGGL